MNAQVDTLDDIGDDNGRLAEDDDEVIAEAKKRMKLCIEADGHNHEEGLADLKFLAGDQWDEIAKRQRQLDGRPCLTINKLPTFLHQVTNDLRQNLPGAKVSGVSDGTDVDTALTVEGIIRHIEYSSNADVAYDTAASSAAANGFGYFRIVTEYSKPDSWDQDLKYKRIRNPFTVYCDPASQEPDGSDAKFWLISTDMPKYEFKSEYPDAKGSYEAFEVGAGDPGRATWLTADTVKVCEYYRIVETPDTLVELTNGESGFKSKLISMPPGVKIKRSRPTSVKTVEWYKLTTHDVLETTIIKCDWIPVFPVYGDELDIDGKVIRSGLVRHSKSAAQMYNVWMHQSLDTPVATPTGWSTIGNLTIGDEVFTESGTPSKVIGKSQVTIGKECFKVTFGDGSNVVCSAEHPWVVEDRGKRRHGGWRWTTKKLRTDELDPKLHCIRAAAPLQLPTAPLPVHPYFLGLWLGDGTSASATITAGARDIDYFIGHLRSLGLDVGCERKYANRASSFTVHGAVDSLRQIGVLKADSRRLHLSTSGQDSKHIPTQYLRASAEQRLDLLRGLMDTDGHALADGKCGFTQKSEEFADQVRELLASLGIKSTKLVRAGRISKMANGHTIVSTGCAQLHFTPPEGMRVFSLPRKAAIQTRERKRHPRRAQHKIVSVERVDSVPVQCIGIDSPKHLYLCGTSMIPTHNTSATEEIGMRNRTPVIGAEGQFEGYEDDWNQANVRSFPYMEYKPVTIDGNLAPPPARQPMADVPQGVLTMAAHAADDIKATTGLFDSSLGNRGNATSGIQERAQQRQGDVANFHYADNLNRAVRQSYRCLISMIPNYLDTARIVRIMGEDRKIAPAKVNTPQTQMQPVPPGTPPPPNAQVDPQTGQMMVAIQTIENDLSVGEYDVTVATGPAYSTLRQEAADAMIEFGKSWPKLMDVAGDKVVQAFDWPGAEEIAERIKRTIPPNILGPDENDDQPPMVQTPRGPIPVAQAGQMLDQMNQQMQAMGQELSQAKSGITKAQIETQSAEKIAQMSIQAEQAREAARVTAEQQREAARVSAEANKAASDNSVKLDIAELNGMVQLLVARAKANDALKADVVHTIMNPAPPTPTATGADKSELAGLVKGSPNDK